MFGIPWKQVSEFVQRGLMFAGGIAVGKGWISEELMVQIVGGLVGIGGVLWGIKGNTQVALVQTVDSMDNVAGVVTKPTADGLELAHAVPSPTVVPAGTVAAATVANGAAR